MALFLSYHIVNDYSWRQWYLLFSHDSCYLYPSQNSCFMLNKTYKYSRACCQNIFTCPPEMKMIDYFIQLNLIRYLLLHFLSQSAYASRHYCTYNSIKFSDMSSVVSGMISYTSQQILYALCYGMISSSQMYKVADTCIYTAFSRWMFSVS